MGELWRCFYDSISYRDPALHAGSVSSEKDEITPSSLRVGAVGDGPQSVSFRHFLLVPQGLTPLSNTRARVLDKGAGLTGAPSLFVAPSLELDVLDLTGQLDGLAPT